MLMKTMKIYWEENNTCTGYNEPGGKKHKFVYDMDRQGCSIHILMLKELIQGGAYCSEAARCRMVWVKQSEGSNGVFVGHQFANVLVNFSCNIPNNCFTFRV